MSGKSDKNKNILPEPDDNNAEVSPADMMPLVYDELRRIAGHALNQRPGVNTLQPTAIVNEAYISLSNRDSLVIKDKNHFLALAAQAIWWVLNDYADTRRAKKRGGGGGWQKVTLDQMLVSDNKTDIDILSLQEVLKKLEQMDEQAASIVKLRYLGGLTIANVAVHLEISESRVKREWQWAKAWLKDELTRLDIDAEEND